MSYGHLNFESSEITESSRHKLAQWDYYRTISLFSSSCIGLCMFGMICGYVSDSEANKNLWLVISLIFLISQSLLHTVDKYTRDQLSRLPVHLLMASRPHLLLQTYYTGWIIDIVSLIIILFISYFFKIPPMIATSCFVLCCSAWFLSNELRLYFVNTLDDVPSCSDDQCAFHTRLDDEEEDEEKENVKRDKIYTSFKDANFLQSAINNVAPSAVPSDISIDNGSSLLFVNKDVPNANAKAFSLKNKYLLKKYDELQAKGSEDINVEFEQQKLNKSSSSNIDKKMTMIIDNKFESIIYSQDGYQHYHYNRHLHRLTTLDGIKIFICVYMFVFIAWLIVIIHQIQSINTMNILLCIVTFLQFIRLCMQFSSLSRQQPSRNNKSKTQKRRNNSANVEKKDEDESKKQIDENLSLEIKSELVAHDAIEHKKYKNKSKCTVRCNYVFVQAIFSPFSMRIFILINSIISGLVFIYGMADNDKDTIFSTWNIGTLSKSQYLFVCYCLSALLTCLSILFLIRFGTQLIYLHKSGTSEYYQKRKDLLATNQNDQKENVQRKRVAKVEEENHLNAQNNDDSAQSNQSIEYKHKKSTWDSSDLLPAHLAHHRSDLISFPHISKTNEVETSFPSRSPSSSDKDNYVEQKNIPKQSKLYEQTAKLRDILQDEEEQKNDSFGDGDDQDDEGSSLLMHAWFRFPYDKYFRIMCCNLSMIILLQIVSLTPNLLCSPYRQIMLCCTLANVFILCRITWSNSFFICWKYYEHMGKKVFLLSYILGMLSTNFAIIYLIFRIFYLESSHYQKEDYSHSDDGKGVISLNCAFIECANSFTFLSIWWPISVLINNEHARFLDRYRKFESMLNKQQMVNVPSTSSLQTMSEQSLISSSHHQNYASSDKAMCGGVLFGSYYPCIESIDGVRPLIPILYLLLLLSFEIGWIQWDDCLSNVRLTCCVFVIFIAVIRGILLIVSI